MESHLLPETRNRVVEDGTGRVVAFVTPDCTVEVLPTKSTPSRAMIARFMSETPVTMCVRASVPRSCLVPLRC